MGRALIVLGITLVLIGALLTVGVRLPGDIVYRGKNTTFYFPWVTCLLLSVLLSVLFWLFGRR